MESGFAFVQNLRQIHSAMGINWHDSSTMTHRRIAFNLIILGLSLSLFGGCKSDPSSTPPPEDQAPVVNAWSANPPSVIVGGTVNFPYNASDSDSNLDSLVATYEPGSVQKLTPGTQQASGQLSHAYNTPGTYNTTLTAWSKGKSAQRSASVVVATDPVPVIILNSINTPEGSHKRIAKSAIATDNGPITFEAVSQHANLVAQFVGDSLDVRGLDEDVNGTYNLLLRVRDNASNTVEKVVPVTIDPRDVISGRVRDFMEGQYVVAAHPELVMQGPFSGWVKVDGVAYSVDAAGNFKTGKLIPSSHTIERFLTNGADSSFVATDNVVSGDRVFDAFVHTNAGTGVTLDALRQFYIEANFGLGIQKKLRGFDFSNAQSQRYYLAGKDTTIGPIIYHKLLPLQQDGAGYAIENDWLNLLAPNKRPQIYKAPQGESLPVLSNGRLIPGTGLIMINNNSGANGTFIAQYESNMLIVESCNITLWNSGSNTPPYYGFIRGTINQEAGSWLCSPTGQVNDGRLGGKTVFHQLFWTDTPTGADIKLLYMVVGIPLGTHIDTQWKLP